MASVKHGSPANILCANWLRVCLSRLRSVGFSGDSTDNLFKPKDRVISGKEMQLRSRRIYNKLPEVTKKREEEKRRLVLQTNRLKADLFKKKLLDQILQRNNY